MFHRLKQFIEEKYREKTEKSIKINTYILKTVMRVDVFNSKVDFSVALLTFSNLYISLSKRKMYIHLKLSIFIFLIKQEVTVSRRVQSSNVCKMF